MKWVMFSKLLKDLDVDRLGEAIKELGFDGIDLAVRPGYPINPDNVSTALPAAAKRWEEMGLVVGLLTTNFDFLDPSKPEVEPLLAACAEAGCRRIKLGYWIHRGEPYWEGVDKIRKALAGFVKLCRKYDVCVAVHNHSGPYYGSNCAGAMHLVRDLDPRHVGVYIDPGHLARQVGDRRSQMVPLVEAGDLNEQFHGECPATTLSRPRGPMVAFKGLPRSFRAPGIEGEA